MSPASVTLTKADVKEKAALERLKPTEADFAGKPGYSRKYKPGGGYDWSYKFRPNEDGKLTNEAQEVGEMMSNFNRVSLEHQVKTQANVSRETLLDGNGRKQYVEAGMADAVARKNGWRSAWKPGGNLVERGSRMMLFRWIAGDWYPLGVRCLGTPLSGAARLPRTGLYRDPSEGVWRWKAGEWRKYGA